MDITLKEHITGGIKPRWTKKKVVKWLEWGAVPAILGLWLPDWSGGYIQLFSELNNSWLAFPPLLLFVGAVILLKASAEGIRNMGWHYKGVLYSGFLAIALAGASLVWHFFISRNPQVFGSLTLFSIVLAISFSVAFLWFTIAKVAEIAVERRTLRIRNIIVVLGVVSLLAGSVASLLIYLQHPYYKYLIRLTIILFTICFGFCRYGVYCYKTQKSIGATHTTPPDEQFWI
ncbi:MAG: hypothetical protein L3J54_00835 [Draconibacterium sp.]|nr:hypothetical protein [Draconibacterium sp.]